MAIRNPLISTKEYGKRLAPSNRSFSIRPWIFIGWNSQGIEKSETSRRYIFRIEIHGMHRELLSLTSAANAQKARATPLRSFFFSSLVTLFRAATLCSRVPWNHRDSLRYNNSFGLEDSKLFFFSSTLSFSAIDMHLTFRVIPYLSR